MNRSRFLGYPTALAVALAASGVVASSGQTPSGVHITLGPGHAVFQFRQPSAMGLFNVPDMHTAVLQEPDKSYLLWITGNIGPDAGSVARLSTRDFLHFQNAGPGTQAHAQPVFTPSCREPARNPRRMKDPQNRRPTNESCTENYDADYAGANAVIPASNGKDLLMLYEAGNKAGVTHGWEYNVIALARSRDRGRTWDRRGVIVRGTDPTPTARTQTTQPGISEPGAVVSNGYIYLIYQYVPNQTSNPAESNIQIARAPLSKDGEPGSWAKYYNGAFTEPGIGGKGTTIVNTNGSGCTRPVEAWPAFSTYLQAYVLTFVCNEGWFFSTSTDLTTWTAPVNFLQMKMWQPCQPMDWNYVLVTPGNQGGTIGQGGLVLYAHTESRGLNCQGGFSPHELWVRSFTFSKSP